MLAQDLAKSVLALLVADHAEQAGDHDDVPAVARQEAPHEISSDTAGAPIVRPDIGPAPAVGKVGRERDHGNSSSNLLRRGRDPRVVGAGED